MNKVVVGEGTHDVLFLSEIIRRDPTYDRHSNYYVTFDNENADITQTRRINKHLVSPHKVLIKSEGGKSKLIRIFCFESCSIVREGYEYVMVIDLDLETIHELIEKLNLRLYEELGNNAKVTLDTLERHTDCMLTRCTLSIKSVGEYTYDMVAFYDDLEEATGILDHEPREIKMEKINRYLDENQSLESSIREILLFG